MKCSVRKNLDVVSLLFLTCSVGFVQVARAQANHLSNLETRWQRGEFEAVLPMLLDYRDKVNDRSANVDYMIATSTCRITNFRQEADKYFQWILKHYVLTREDRDLIIEERRTCLEASLPRRRPSSATPSLVGALFYTGKEGFYTKAETGRRSSIIKIDEEESIPLETFRDRLFTISQQQPAAQRTMAELRRFQSSTRDDRPVSLWARHRVTVETTQNFVLGSVSGHTRNQLALIGQTLENYLQFYVSRYSLPAPSHLITVYLLPDNILFSDLAYDLHRVAIGDAIGYSFPYDQSMMAIIPRMRYGTLKHELFHLMVRKNFGDIPPWLEEGMATLYEVSRPRQNGIVGIPSWRGRVLLDARKQWPSLRDLVSMDWDSFAGEPTETREKELIADREYYKGTRQEINHAMARYFALYLQERQKLADVYKAFRERKVNANPDQQAVSILESVLQRQLDSVEIDFRNWFRSIPPNQHR